MDAATTLEKLRETLGRRGSALQIPVREGWSRAAVLVPLFGRDDRPHVLFTERTHNLPRHKGEISFPGGRVDPEDATVLDAALRETHEEIGVSPQRVEVLGRLDDIITITNYVISPYVGWLSMDEGLDVNPGEIEKVHEIELNRLMDPSVYECKRDYEFRGRPYPVHFFYMDEATVWGATAKILLQLLQEVFAWEGAVASGQG